MDILEMYRYVRVYTYACICTYECICTYMYIEGRRKTYLVHFLPSDNVQNTARKTVMFYFILFFCDVLKYKVCRTNPTDFLQ